MKRLITMLAAAVASFASAWAATVTFLEGSTTDFTVINSTGNAGNYNWNGYNNAFGIKIPAAEGLAEGTKVYLKSLTFVMGGGDLSSANVPDSITIAGYTVNKDATQKNDGLGGNTDRNKVIYAFAEGSRPVLTVGTEAHVTTTGLANLRALPTSSNADKEDPLIVILNNKEYQPVAKVEASIAPDFTTAEITTDKEGVDAIEWSNGEPSATTPGILTINEGVTLSVTDLSSLANVTLAGAGTLKLTGTNVTLNGRYGYTSPVIFGAEWSGVLHLVGTTLSWFDLDKFAGVGTIKMTGVTGNICGAGATDGAFHGTIILEDGENDTVAFNLNDGFGTTGYVFDVISGSGTLKLTGQTSAQQQLVFKNFSDFTGTVEVLETNNKKSVLFGNAKDVTAAGQGCIIFAASATIPEGKTWTARNAFLIKQNATLTVPASFASAVKGAGKLAGYTAFTQVTDAVKTSLQDAAWTGSLVVTGATIQNGAVTNYKTTLNNFGNAGSKIEFAGSCNGYFGLSRLNAGDTEVAILPELVISGTLALNDGFTQKDGYEYYYTLINKLSGTGALSCSKSSINPLLIVKDGASYAGSIAATYLKVVFGEPAETMTTVENNTLTIAEGYAATVAANKAFTAGNGVVVDGTLTIAANASAQVVDKLTIGESGTVSISRSDWFKFSTGSRQDIVIKGTLNLNSTRQTLYPNNPITLYPGAKITANATSSDGGCHLNFYNAPVLKLVAEEGNEATEATISAIVGPQGTATTVEVAEGLTLNFTETNSSSVALRQGSLIKSGDGILKITGDYGTLTGFTLSAGKIVTTADAVLPMTEDETPVAKITVAEGSTLYTKTDDNGVTTYQLTEFVDGPTEISGITEDNVMDVVPEAIQTADAGKLASWIKETSGITTIEGLSSINVNCFLMGVENSVEDPELKISAEDLEKILDAESLEDAAAALQSKYPNATVTVKDVTTKICGEGATNTHLYQLELSLPTAE